MGEDSIEMMDRIMVSTCSAKKKKTQVSQKVVWIEI